MRIRGWQDIVADVVDADVDPNGWRAVGGTRARGVGEDLYFGHPRAGVYQLKTYAKNPYEVRGVGAKIARNLDDEIGSYLPTRDDGGRFAVRTPPSEAELADEALERKAGRLEATLKAHADAPTNPGDLFDDLMEVLESPAFGPMDYDQYGRPDELAELTDSFEEAEELLEAEFEDLVDDDGVNVGFQ